VFRRWEKPRVRVGSRLKTRVGVLEVSSVDVVDEVGPDDARAAGFSSPEEVYAAMRPRGAIHENPEVRAGDLAERFGVERLDFKRDVRKLKELGLTISLEVGYRLSRRGQLTLSSRPNARRNTSP
jgi:hypothetical protein